MARREDLNRVVADYLVPIHTTVEINRSVEEALSDLRNRYIDEKIIYIYVVDGEKKLLGYIPIRKFLLSDPQSTIKKIMHPHVISLHVAQTLKEAMEYLERYKLLALPVVDNQGVLVGVIDVNVYLDEKVDIGDAERRQDIFQLIGLSLEEGKRYSVWQGYRKRMPWIFCNMFGGTLCAIILRIYEQLLTEVILLAMFIPLLLTISESVSMQSMTQSMHMLKKKSHHFFYFLRCLKREWITLCFLTTTSALLVGVISFFWGDGIAPPLTIAVSLLVGVLLSAILGSIVPLVLHAKKWDPHVAAGPVVLMFADILTTFIYLTLGTLWLL